MSCYITIRQLHPRTTTHLGLKPPLEHFLGGELKHEVKLLLVLTEQTKPRHAAEKGRAFKQTLRVLRVERKELAGCLLVRDNASGKETCRHVMSNFDECAMLILVC